MDFTLIPPKSALRKFWSPKLTFTGTSVMGVNPANGAKLHVRKTFACSGSFAPRTNAVVSVPSLLPLSQHTVKEVGFILLCGCVGKLTMPCCMPVYKRVQR